MTTFFNHLCLNCKVWLEPGDPSLCQACEYLLHGPRAYVGMIRSNGETEKFVNRRWQMRFNRGELAKAIKCDAGVLWEKKQKEQDW